MKIKLQDFITLSSQGQEQLNEGILELNKTDLPIKISYWLNKIINNTFLPELKTFSAKRSELLKKYGTQQDPKKDVWSIEGENTAKFFEEIEQLLDIEIEIEWTKINIDDLVGIKIKPKFIVPFLFK